MIRKASFAASLVALAFATAAQAEASDPHAGHHMPAKAVPAAKPAAKAVAKPVADKTDGGHLDAANTKAIGTALVPVEKRILAI